MSLHAGGRRMRLWGRLRSGMCPCHKNLSKSRSLQWRMICNGDRFALEISYIMLQCMCCYATSSSHRSHVDTPLSLPSEGCFLDFTDKTNLWVTSCVIISIISSRNQKLWWTRLGVHPGPAVCCSGARCFPLIWPCFPADFLICMQSSATLSLSLQAYNSPRVTLQRTDKEL